MKTKHFYQTDPTYKSWESMRARCNNPNNTRYQDYGGRGIQCCPEWKDFEQFQADMGNRPAGTSLDRKDNNGNYTKDNCRWATKEQQQRNTRRSVLTKEFVDCIYYAQDTSNLSDRELARQLGAIFGIKADAIREVLKGRCWKRGVA